MNKELLEQGTEVTVRAFGGKELRRRVWEDLGDAILVCTEEEYQRAFHRHEEATCSGLSKAYIIEVHTALLEEGA